MRHLTADTAVQIVLEPSTPPAFSLATADMSAIARKCSSVTSVTGALSRVKVCYATIRCYTIKQLMSVKHLAFIILNNQTDIFYTENLLLI